KTFTAIAVLAFLVTLAGSRLVGAQQAAPRPTPAAAAKPEPELHVLPVQGNIYMIVGAGANITASIGRDGILLVDAGSAEMSGKVLSLVLQMATAITATPMPNRCVGLHCPETPYGWSSPSLNAII